MSQEPDSSKSTDPKGEADDKLLHALLVHLHDDQAEDRRRKRVERVVAAIRQPSVQSLSSDRSGGAIRSRVLRFPVWARRAAYAAAAVVLVAAGVLVLTYNPAPAMASLNDILSSLGKPGDRTYHITMEDLPEPPGRPPPDEGPPDDRPRENAPRPGLDDATLYLRDGKQYLLARQDPNGGMIFDGYDGKQSWRITRGVLAETKEGLGAGGIPIPPMMADVPFADLHQTLERMRTDYKIEQDGQAPLPTGGATLRYVRARRNSHEVKGPQTIEIWADPTTAVPKRIVFDDAKIQGNRQPCRLTFDLASQEPLAADWFSPAPHVSTDAGRTGAAPTTP